MSIELTRGQSEAVPAGNLGCDDSAWTPAETAVLAAAAFGELDDTDYSHYLSDAR